MRLHRVSDIFENKPEQWGLRGDENYWKYLYSYYKNNPDIDSYLHDISIDKIYIDIANVYKKLFNDELFSDNKFSVCSTLNTEGISGSIISPQWWNSVGKSFIRYVYDRLLFIDNQIIS